MRKATAAVFATVVALAGCEKTIEPTQSPIIRYEVDSARERVWTLTLDGVLVTNTDKSGKVVVSLPGWTWAGPAYACLPALALGPKGQALITSNVLPTIWTVDPVTLAVTAHPLALDSDTDKDVGFSALVYSVEHAAFFGLSETYGTLWKIDAALTRAEKVTDARVNRRLAQRAGRVRAAACADLRPHQGWLSSNDG